VVVVVSLILVEDFRLFGGLLSIDRNDPFCAVLGVSVVSGE
jgi:hypothetical protein